jgi:hypothetical protein
MSLLDRLKRDEKLREDMLSLLREFALDAELKEQEQLQPKSNPMKGKQSANQGASGSGAQTRN